MITPSEFKKAQEEFFDEEDKKLVKDFVDNVLFEMQNYMVTKAFKYSGRYSFEVGKGEEHVIIEIMNSLIELGWNVRQHSPEPYGNHYIVIDTSK